MGMPSDEPLLEERRLVAGLLRREEAAWSAFLDVYGPVIVRAGRRVLGSASPRILDELAGEVCLRLLSEDCRLLRGFRGESALATWVWCVARGAAVDRLRREGRPLPSPKDEVSASAGDLASKAEAAQRLRQAVGTLPEQARTALRMAYWEERSYAEIATALGLSPDSVGPLLARAKAELGKILETRTGAPP